MLKMGGLLKGVLIGGAMSQRGGTKEEEHKKGMGVFSQHTTCGGR